MCFIFYSGAETIQPEAEQIENFSINEIYNNIDDDTQKSLERMGINEISSDEITEVDLNKILDYVFSLVKDNFTAPFNVLAIIMAVTIVSSLMGAVNVKPELQSSKILNMIATMTILASVSVPIINLTNQCREAIDNISDFITAFVPVFISVSAAGGSLTSSSVYSSYIFIALEIIGKISANVIVPMISIILVLSLLSSVAETGNFTSLTDMISKSMNWILGILFTLFAGISSMQTFVAASSDTLTIKTTKYLIGNTIPVVGGTISDTFNTLYSSINLVKTTTGVFGIIVIAIVFLPILISIIMFKMSFFLSGTVANLFGNEKLSNFIKSVNSCLSVMLGIIIFSFLILILLTAVTVAQRAGA